MFAKVVIVVALVALAVAYGARPSGSANGRRVYVVQPGDTLWAIAAARYPGDVRAAVWRLQERNGLATASLAPGERLILPP